LTDDSRSLGGGTRAWLTTQTRRSRLRDRSLWNRSRNRVFRRPGIPYLVCVLSALRRIQDGPRRRSADPAHGRRRPQARWRTGAARASRRQPCAWTRAPARHPPEAARTLCPVWVRSGSGSESWGASSRGSATRRGKPSPSVLAKRERGTQRCRKQSGRRTGTGGPGAGSDCV